MEKNLVPRWFSRRLPREHLWQVFMSTGFGGLRGSLSLMGLLSYNVIQTATAAGHMFNKMQSPSTQGEGKVFGEHSSSRSHLRKGGGGPI